MSEYLQDREIHLIFPAQKDMNIIAGMALSGFGMLIGLDIDILGDLRMVVNECLDCMLHQESIPDTIAMQANTHDHLLQICFKAQNRMPTGAGDDLETDVTKGILETLMPIVQLQSDQSGVYSICCAMQI